MSDRETILLALEQIRRRLRLSRTLHDATTVLGMVAVALLLFRALHIFAGRAPELAVAVIAALLLWVAGLIVLARSVLAARCTLGAAAETADLRADLKDELKTAYWFVEHPVPSPWIAAQLARAARSARRLDPAALLPLRVDRRAVAGGAVAALLLLVAWLVPPLAPSSDAALPADALSDADARQVQLVRELIAQTDDRAVADKLERALEAVERKSATAEQKQRALAEARRAIEQQNLQAASTREGLYKLSEKLHGNQSLEDVAKALEEGNAERAAALVKQMAEANAPADGPGDVQRPGVGADRQEPERDLERLLKDAAGGEDRAAQREVSSAAAREAVDRLNKIAEQLEAQGRLKQAAQALQQLQLAVAQRSALSAGRFSQQAAQNATPAPETGQTNMPGGVMFRAAAVAKEAKASQQQEGSKTGAALGDSQADPVLGRRVTPLEVQLKQESIAGDQQDNNEAAPKNWFYAESKEQMSIQDLQDVRARSNFASGQTTAQEGISIQHRQIVKEYFMQLREGSPR